MKIYFEDGKLVGLKRLPVTPDYVMNAADGVTENLKLLDILSTTQPDCVIYTNSILAFSNRYAWNQNLQLPEIWIRDHAHGLFTNITNFTERELREGRNLAHLYINGEFH